MNITPDNYELFFFQYAEKMLCDEDRRQVETFVQSHPNLKEELSYYDPQLKLAPIVTSFPNKEQLFHSAVHKTAIGNLSKFWYYAVAACVALLLVVGGVTLNRRSSKPAPTIVAQKRFSTPSITTIPSVTISTTFPTSIPTSPTKTVPIKHKLTTSVQPSPTTIGPTIVPKEEPSTIEPSTTYPTEEHILYTDGLITFVEPSATPTHMASTPQSFPTTPEDFKWQNFLVQQSLASIQRDTVAQEYLVHSIKLGRALFAMWGHLQSLGEELEPTCYAIADNMGEKVDKYNIFR